MKRIVYKDKHEKIVKEIKMPVNQYFSEPDNIMGKYKTQEIYVHKELARFTIFIDPQEGHTKILNKADLQGVIIDIGQREQPGEFRHEKLFQYDRNKDLKTIFNTVFDNQNNVVVSSFTDDIENEIPYWNGTSKYYYDKSIRANDSLFECHYDDHGKLIPITVDVEELSLGDQDSIWIYNDVDGIKALMNVFNMPKVLAEFYVSSEIIPKITSPDDR
ncbi:MAG: hypothetical protein AAF502_21635 [Bacteroidota bacterium]